MLKQVIIHASETGSRHVTHFAGFSAYSAACLYAVATNNGEAMTVRDIANVLNGDDDAWRYFSKTGRDVTPSGVDTILRRLQAADVLTREMFGKAACYSTTRDDRVTGVVEAIDAYIAAQSRQRVRRDAKGRFTK